MQIIIKRLRLAWRFREWPWRVPWEAVKYLSLEKPTRADLERSKLLAEKHGWV